MSSFSDILLKWYNNNKREFPWRNTDNLFHVLLAEVMLKRTTSTHVNKVYSKFITSYPNPKAVIKAPKDEVVNVLTPLGLQNQRYKHIKSICNIIDSKYNNEVPKERDKLLEIKGVGDYIANATLCFGDDQRLPVVDSNVERIIRRVFGVKKANIKDKIYNILPEKNYRDFNFALLDFGALICRPVHPKCECCPIKCCIYFNKNEG